MATRMNVQLQLLRSIRTENPLFPGFPGFRLRNDLWNSGINVSTWDVCVVVVVVVVEIVPWVN